MRIKRRINKKRFLDKILSDLLGGYSKENLKSAQFLPFVKIAIKQAKGLDLDTKER